MIIYCATNKVNGKKYIGQTVQRFSRRKNAHLLIAKNGSLMPFHCAIRKYGEENFKWEIVYHATSLQDLNKAEEYLIAEYRSREHGYNIMYGGGNRDCPASVRKKLSDSHKGEKNHNYGKQFSIEHRRKIGEAQVGEKHHFFGKQHSAEHRRKLGEAQRGRTHSAETRARLSVINKGKQLSAETRRKIGEAKKGTQVGEKNPMFDKRIFPFYHEKHGLVSCTKLELRERFGLGTSSSPLSEVLSGKRLSYKGWRAGRRLPE